MRIYLILAALMALAALSACENSASKGEVEEQVESAMEGLPYKYRLLSTVKAEHYVTFAVVNPRQKLEVTFAYGLPAENGGCLPFPELPPHRKSPKPAVAAGPEPLICLEDDSWRRGSGNRESVVRRRIVGDVAKALCEEAHDELACFI